MAYTPPAGDNVDFTFQGGYTPPAGDNVNFLYGSVAENTIDSISRNYVLDDAVHDGYVTSVIRWHSSLGGPYRVEMSGSGVSTGDLVKSGNTFANFVVRTEISDSDIEGATTFSGAGTYRFNVYVKSADNIWTPYNN